MNSVARYEDDDRGGASGEGVEVVENVAGLNAKSEKYFRNADTIVTNLPARGGHSYRDVEWFLLC